MQIIANDQLLEIANYGRYSCLKIDHILREHTFNIFVLFFQFILAVLRLGYKILEIKED